MSDCGCRLYAAGTKNKIYKIKNFIKKIYICPIAAKIGGFEDRFKISNIYFKSRSKYTFCRVRERGSY